MITVNNIQPKRRTVYGKVYEPDETNAYHADIVPGKSIRIYGEYKNTIHGPRQFDQTFTIGDQAEYDSYNLKYNGRIVSIGKKTVTIKHYENSDRVTRLDLYKFSWRNWDFDLEKSEKENSETMMYI